MLKGKTIIGIIAAKANSKRFPNKNIQLLGGKPLISWTFDSVKSSKYLDRIIVTTDSIEITNLAKEQGVEAPFKRPKYLAQDITSSEETVIHALTWLKEKEQMEYDYLVLFQPTSPFRKSFHIDESIEKIIEHEAADALVSVSNVLSKVQWLKVLNVDGYLIKTVNQNYESETKYFPNGAIYIIKTDVLLKKNTFYPKKTIPYVMEENYSIDIDTQEDLKSASIILNNLNEKKD